MGGQFQADIDALNQFVKDVQDKGGLIDQIMTDPQLLPALQAMASSHFAPPPEAAKIFAKGQIDFGQSIPGFESARLLCKDYDTKFGGFAANFAAYINALTVIAEAAKSLADSYTNAADYDQVSAQTVQDAFSNAKNP